MAGTTGTVLALQPASDTKELPATAADAAAEATGRPLATTSDTDDTDDTDDASDDVSTKVEDADETAPADAASYGEHETFGAWVSEQAQEGGVDGQAIAEAAKARNEERRADRAKAADQGERGGPPDHAKGAPGEDDDEGDLDTED